MIGQKVLKFLIEIKKSFENGVIWYYKRKVKGLEEGLMTWSTLFSHVLENSSNVEPLKL